uniref:TLC domain-containing protein n=1 Tax=Haemonchus contortus TaxID=6289 RepID=A0A7I5E7T9_HAECO
FHWMSSRKWGIVTANDTPSSTDPVSSHVQSDTVMFRLFFLFGVSVVLRLEYLLAAAIVRAKAREWSENKIRIFSARVISLTHATLSSIGCLCSLLSDSEYVKEPYDYSTYSAQYIFLFSMGYFIYDMTDMYIHGEAPYSKEYFIHHSLVLTAFSIILYTGKLFGFAMIGLLVEVQTIFLHLRTMIRLTGYAKKRSPAYNALINANMVCLFLFRHVPVTYLLYVMLYKDENCPLPLRAFLTCGLAFLTYHNTHLTISMVKADGFFGYEMQSLDEDHVDPLGPVKVKKS